MQHAQLCGDWRISEPTRVSAKILRQIRRTLIFLVSSHKRHNTCFRQKFPTKANEKDMIIFLSVAMFSLELAVAKDMVIVARNESLEGAWWPRLDISLLSLTILNGWRYLLVSPKPNEENRSVYRGGFRCYLKLLSWLPFNTCICL